MKSTTVSGVFACVLLVVGSASADVIDAACYDDGDGAVTMGDWMWSWDGGDYTAYMDVPEVQHWGPAHIFTQFVTNGPGDDPFAWVTKVVENDTDFDWTGYFINVSAVQPFTIEDAASPAGWLNPIITPPVETDGVWKGVVEYAFGGPGTEIAIGSTGTFGVEMSFQGTVTFCIDQIPVPEPTSLSLLALGALALLRRR